MILSDRSIRELCIRPTHKFNEKEYLRRKLAEEYAYGKAVCESPHAPYPELDYDLLAFTCTSPLSEAEKNSWRPMIEPFSAQQVRTITRHAEPSTMHLFDQEVAVTPPSRSVSCISSGLTSYGYDVSLADDFRVFTNIHSAVIDPKRLDPKCLASVKAQYDDETGERYVLMPPNSYLLGSTKEYFVVPRDIMIICVGKSTYARSGAIVNVTPIEPGFEGNVVIEISNSTNLPAKIYADEGIAQFMFFRGDRECETSYGDRAGKYQGQTGITLPKV